MLDSLIKQLLQISAVFVIPDWGQLVQLIPLGLLALVLLWFALTIRRFATAGPTRRAPARLTPVAPADVHMPGPSLAPFLAAFGAAALVWGLVVGGLALAIGATILVLTLLYWGREAIRDFDRINPPTPLPVAEHAGPPEGVHMPGPSIRPFMAALGATVLLGGLVAGGWMLVVGVVFLFWTLAGWLVDARAEYVKTVEADRTGHLENIPTRRFPTGLIQAFVVLFVVVGLIQLGVLPPKSASDGGTAAGSPGASGAASLPPGTLVVVAQGVAFDVKTLDVAAGKPFSIQFKNEDSGVPHNIEIRSSDGATVLQTQDNVDGVNTVVYQFKALQPGTYEFICKVHPIPAMTGTITVK